jgi:hypothetical protein
MERAGTINAPERRAGRMNARAKKRLTGRSAAKASSIDVIQARVTMLIAEVAARCQ